MFIPWNEDDDLDVLLAARLIRKLGNGAIFSLSNAKFKVDRFPPTPNKEITVLISERLG
jgi:hypothetical protein